MANPDEKQEIRKAMADVFGPMIELAIAQGLTYGDLDDIVRRSLVTAAKKEGAETVSAIHARTGLNRREVSRLLEAASNAPLPGPSMLSMIYDRLTGDPDFIDENGRAKTLPRLRRNGGEHSFEALVESISRDVRPRPFLDLLVSRGLAEIDANDCVSIARWQSAMGSNNPARTLYFNLIPLAKTVSDNVLKRAPRLPAYSFYSDAISSRAAATLVKQEAPRIESALFALNRQIAEVQKRDHEAGELGEHKVYFGFFVTVDPPVQDLDWRAPNQATPDA